MIGGKKSHPFLQNVGEKGGVWKWFELYSLEKEGPFEPVTEDAGQIAYEGNPCDFLHVPAEGDLLKAHHDYTGSGTDDEHRTAHTSTVGQKLPEDAIDGHVACGLNGIHAHTSGHEGHVVNDGREYADDAGDEIMVAVEGFVEALAQTGEYADFLQYGHGHEDAEEEHDGAEVDA